VEDPDAWQRLRHEQSNVVSHHQFLAHGITVAMIRANVAAGRWVPLFHGVYALVTGDPTPAMWRQAALLFIRGPAMLSHATAAAVLGLPGGSDELPIHVTVPYTSSARGCAGIVVHRSRAFEHLALANAVPPVTSKSHTLVDLAVEASTARDGMRVLTAGATQAHVPGERIAAALEVRRPRRYRRALEAAARMLIEGVESVLEAWYAEDVELTHGLPPSTRQVGRVVEGRRRAEDLEYAMPGGTLTVRLDGWRTHANRRTARVDRARDNAAELEGRARLTFGYDEVRDAPCVVARVVAARLQQLGWRGEIQRCTSCS
jgi:hypothetical protein